MTGRLFALAVAVLLAADCSQLKQGRCNASSDCTDPQTPFCYIPDKVCIAAPDAGVHKDAGSDAHDAAHDVSPLCSVDVPSCAAQTPICDPMTRACRGCETGDECLRVDRSKAACLIPQGAGDAGNVSDAGNAHDAGHSAGATGACVECIDRSTCSGGTPACDLTTHSCVQCIADTDCPDTAPVCDPHTRKCGACASDNDCARFAPAAPGVCKMTFATTTSTDAGTPPARCATASEVVIVDESSGCSDAGTSSTYCNLSTAVAALTPARNILIIVGGTSDRLMLATTNVAPVVIGRKNDGGDPGNIPATTGTAVTVSSDTVVIRDLTVNLGSSATSRGIGISGASTSATLQRVTATLTTGLGVDVENGATAFIDQSYVQNNSVGGILVNGATATIQNSIITDNAGYGVQLNNAGASSKFWFNTVVNNGVAAGCNLGATIGLQNSIVVGSTLNCPLPVNSLTTAPTFASPPYHLAAHKPCPSMPTSFPDHDVDGDPRGTDPDCGADQYTGK